MSETPASNGDEKRDRRTEDPLRTLVDAMRDVWAMATAEGNAMPHTDHNRLAESFPAAFKPFLRAAVGLNDLAETALGVLGAASKSPEGADRLPRGVEVLAQAYLVAVVSGLRYWRRVAETSAIHHLGLMQSLAASAADPNMSEEERRILIDEIRTYFRDLGDVSAQEARAFQSELDKLAERVASVVLGPEQASDHRRRWRVKP